MGKKPTYEELEQRINWLEEKALEGRQAQGELRNSEKRLEQVVEGNSIPTFVIDNNHTITHWNKACENLTGFSASEVVGTKKQWSAFYSGERPVMADFIVDGATEEEMAERYKHIGYYNKSVLIEGAYECENLYPDLGEKGRWLFFTAAPLRDRRGKIVGAIETFQDITERKQAEEGLRESEDRFKALANSLPQVVFEMDERGNFTFTNHNAFEVFGYRQNDFDKGLKALEMLIPQDRERGLENMQRILSGEGLGGLEYTALRKDGSIFPIVIHSNPIIRGNKPVGLRGIITDITERKRAEEQLKEYAENLEAIVKERTHELELTLHDTEKSRDKIDGILKSVADGLIVTDTYRRIILMNLAAEELLGVRFSEVIDQPIDVAIRDKNLKEFFKFTPDKTKTELFLDFELPGKDKKHPRIIRAKRTPIKNKRSAHVGTIILMEDVTREHEIDRMKTELISTVAHELKTPLTSIQGYSELLISRDDIQEKERKEFLTYINDRSKHLAAIVNNMLYISGIESGIGIQIKKEPVDMTELIRESVSAFQKRYPDRVFKIDLPEGKDSISMDRKKMGLVLENLLSNAVKFSSSNTAVAIRGEKTDKYYQVFIEDEGIGMTTEQADKIFDKLYRADMSSAAVEGAGLGMTIVRYIIEAHNGTIHVKSSHGKGTVVKFLLKI